jgi:hypothetical protein
VMTATHRDTESTEARMPKILSASVPLCVVVRSTHVAYGITGREFG